MKETIYDFEKGVYGQALSAGMDESTATRVAAQAVIDRLDIRNPGFAVAQTDEFQPTFVYEFKLTNYRVDQSMESGVVVEAILGSQIPDVAGQAFSEEALLEFAEQINSGGIGGFIDEHRSFRATQDRLSSNAVTDWVKARVEDGMLWITAKLKRGFEWVASQFDSVSLEAVIPKQKTLINANKKLFLGGGFLKGFVFTNNPKNTMHRIVDTFTE